MKKIIALILALTMVAVLFAGCTTPVSNETPTESLTEEVVSEEPTAPADDSWDKIVAKGKLVLGFDKGFPPMGYEDQDGSFVGFDLDVAQAVSDKLGIELELVPINWDNKIIEINTGNIDCIWNGFSVTPEREEQLNMTVTYMQNCQVVMVAADSAYSSIEDLVGKRIAVQRDSSAEDALNNNTAVKSSFAEVVALDDYVACMNELRIGSVDAIAIDEIVARHYMGSGGFRMLQEDDGVYSLADEHFAVGFRKTDNALASKILETLRALESEGKIAEISTKWFGSNVVELPQ